MTLRSINNDVRKTGYENHRCMKLTGLCPLAHFGICSVESQGSVITFLVNLLKVNTVKF
jgi:hypothetical protein